ARHPGQTSAGPPFLTIFRSVLDFVLPRPDEPAGGQRNPSIPGAMEPPDFKNTLSVPRTGFPMQADLPRREPKILEQWDRMDVYAALRRSRSGRPRHVLHDGPPHANGNIQLGRTLHKI